MTYNCGCSDRIVFQGIIVGLLGCLFTVHPLAQPSPTPDNPAPSVHVLFTGRLLGYFRLPDQQDGTAPASQQVCPSPKSADGNVKTFLETVKQQRTANTVLVGMGDNFAPQLFARIFSPANSAALYSKDLYNWDPDAQRPGTSERGAWVLTDQVMPSTQQTLANGGGFIPMDNVGCFLAAAQYTAIVPGKQDFYFGPERLRLLARFLATPGPNHSGAVQMLAANLVIRTNWVKKRAPLTDAEKHLDYSTADDQLKPLNVADSQHVLPWLRQIIFETDPKNISNLKVNLYESVAGNPSARQNSPSLGQLEHCFFELDDDRSPRPLGHCSRPLLWSPRGEKKKQTLLAVNLEPPRGNRGLRAGQNYLLCLDYTNVPNQSHRTYCLRFSVDHSFFQYPNTVPRKADGQTYNDPEPYVWKCLGQTPPGTPLNSCPAGNAEVAIFGVVDPRLKEHVGELNYAWWNDSDRQYKTEIELIDPAEALEQLQQDLALEHPNFHDHGIKVLLAQMSLPLAQRLVARLRGSFHVVVAEAQVEHATLDQEVTLNASDSRVSPSSTSMPPPGKSRLPPPTFLVVPAPYYDPTADKYALAIGNLTVDQPSPSDRKWKFTLKTEQRPASADQAKVIEQPWFRTAVENALNNTLSAAAGTPLPPLYQRDIKASFRDLTLSLIRKKSNADVALMQKRDFFFDSRLSAQEVASHNLKQATRLQQAADRLLWKGDFVVKRLVKGTTLKTLLTRSKEFDKQDVSNLSLEIETGRGLVQLGAQFDPEREEYLINGEPLDENRLYTIATTDYLGLGDTGYPELLVPPVGDAMLPRDFESLYAISSLVAEAIGGPQASAVSGNYYFDHLYGSPFDMTGKTYGHRLARWLHLSRAPAANPWEKMSKLERQGQERGVWFLSLGKASASLTEVRNNVDEATRQDQFPGAAEPRVQAPKSSDFKFASGARLGYSGDRWEWFIGEELAHARTSKAQRSALPALSFIDNKLVSELGFFWRTKGKRFPHFGPQLSLRDETQLFEPIESFGLGDPKKSTLTFSRERTHTPTMRLGFRWQDRESNFLTGIEHAWLGGLKSFLFIDPSGNETRCPVNGDRPLIPGEPSPVKVCVLEKSAGPMPAITLDSRGKVDISMTPRYGYFFTGKIVWPSFGKVSYVTEQDFELFSKRPDDNPTRTRWRYLMSHAVRFKIFENFSVTPTVELFFYENQRKGDFFRQRRLSIEFSYGFDLFSGYPGRAMRYKKPEK